VHHDDTLFRVKVDADAFDVGHAFRFQQAFGAHAIRAAGRVIENNMGCHR